MSEQEIQNNILIYLNMQKDFFAWRNNSTGLYSGGVWRKKSGFNIAGVSDILGIHESGKLIAIEVKTDKVKNPKPSDVQEIFLNKINKMNGHVLCTNSLKDVVSFVEKIRGENGLVK